jgi:hypothetical protein
VSRTRIDKTLERSELKNASIEMLERVEDLTKRVERLERLILRQENDAEPVIPVLNLDFSELTYLKQLRSTREMCLALLDYTFAKDSNTVGLTPSEIESIFRERFALPVPLTSISVALLRAAGTFVTRIKVEGKPVTYRYRILPRGQETIRAKIEELRKRKH